MILQHDDVLITEIKSETGQIIRHNVLNNYWRWRFPRGSKNGARIRISNSIQSNFAVFNFGQLKEMTMHANCQHDCKEFLFSNIK